MIGIKNSGIVLALYLLLATPIATAQAQTKESAHGFLASVINKGATREYDSNPYVSYVGSNCNSQLVAVGRRDRKQWQVDIDWSSVSAVEMIGDHKEHDSLVIVKGAIVRSGEVTQYAWFWADSKAMAERFGKALEFLRVQCDKTKQFGF